ncbi:MAG: redoxin domain-containing protein [Actinomycetota bacterium]
MPIIEAGTAAPDFTLTDQDGNEVSLSDLEGQTNVLVFYALDFSPTCTDQLNVYQEVLGELEEQGAKLYGISIDSAFAHKAFQDHLGVTIPLLADFEPKGEVAKAYGVYIDERGHNQRALVMIGPDLEVKWSYHAPTSLEIPGANLIFDALEKYSGDVAAEGRM